MGESLENQFVDQGTAAQAQGKKKRGCSGCLVRGCGCFGLIGAAVLLWIWWPSRLPDAPPEMDLWPPTVMDVLYSRELDHLVDVPGMYSPAGYLQPLIKEAALTRSRTASVTRFATKDGPLVIFDTAQAQETMRRLEFRGYSVTKLGGLTLLVSPRSQPFGVPSAWLVVHDHFLVVGSQPAVETLARIVTQGRPSLLVARPELKPFFHYLGSSGTLWAVVQNPAVEAATKNLPPIITALRATLGPLASLLTIQAMGVAGDRLPDGCRARFAQLFGSRLASFTMARLDVILKVTNFLADEKDPSKAKKMTTFRSGRFVSLDMVYSESRCRATLANQKAQDDRVRW